MPRPHRDGRICCPDDENLPRPFHPRMLRYMRPVTPIHVLIYTHTRKIQYSRWEDRAPAALMRALPLSHATHSARHAANASLPSSHRLNATTTPLARTNPHSSMSMTTLLFCLCFSHNATSCHSLCCLCCSCSCCCRRFAGDHRPQCCSQSRSCTPPASAACT